MMGIRPNTAVKPECLNGTFQCPGPSHTGKVQTDSYTLMADTCIYFASPVAFALVRSGSFLFIMRIEECTDL